MIRNYDEVMDYLDLMIKKGGPDPQDYDKLTHIVESLEPTEIEDFRKEMSSALDENTLIGHGFVKPFGYAGDFLLIDKIYHYTVNDDPRYKNWDIYFQVQPGATAVRNRKDYFKKVCESLIRQKPDASVLILGSGPATDVNEFLSSGPGRKNIKFDLVDYDQTAIDFSMKKNERFSDQISYYRINALRYNSFKLYDLIWSAGMFDYFKDKHFTFLIRKYYSCLADDGELIIGNFSTKNPTRKLMEYLSDWYLNLRTESDLYRMSADAGIDKELVTVEKEPLGINLFLRIKKNK